MKGYFDYAATTPLDEEVLEAMKPLFTENFGNPDSLHSFGRKAAYAVACARDSVAQTLGVRAEEVYFTSGGTEADNWAVRCMGRGSVCVSNVEHHAALEGATLREGGYTPARANSGGRVTAHAVKEGLREDTGLVCVQAVNNETGVVQPVAEISALCRARGILFFSDCVQAAGTMDLKEIARLTDGLSLSAHKIYGPKGTGALVVKKGVPLSALVKGGEQERGLRGGTLNAAGIVGFAYALKKAQAEREENSRKIGALRDLFERLVCGEIADAVPVKEERVPNISHFVLPKGGPALLDRLDLCGVACSGGAACSAHSLSPSHVLLAMGKSETDARKGLRFSFGKDTTEEDVKFAAQTLIKVYEEI